MDGHRYPRLLSLRIRNLRNLRSLTLDLEACHRGICITGGNGAGKTALLEAVYLLARGRTFRGRKAGPLTTDGEQRTIIECRFQQADAQGDSILSFERTPRESVRQCNGWVLRGQSPHESPLLVKLVGENPQALLEGQPALRRALLDWNVFHVEHRFGGWRNDLRRVLSQRNAALRQGSRAVAAWDGPFIEFAERIHDARRAFVSCWRTEFTRLADGFPFLDGCDLRYKQGWARDADLGAALERSRHVDLTRCQTASGPHRADLVITRDGVIVRLSRGQAKAAVCLLQLAAEQVHRANGLKPSIWLLDDLAAEIDAAAFKRLRSLYAGVCGQCITTRVGVGDVIVGNAPSPNAQMSHMEHPTRGQSKPVDAP